MTPGKETLMFPRFRRVAAGVLAALTLAALAPAPAADAITSDPCRVVIGPSWGAARCPTGRDFRVVTYCRTYVFGVAIHATVYGPRTKAGTGKWSRANCPVGLDGYRAISATWQRY